MNVEEGRRQMDWSNNYTGVWIFFVHLFLLVHFASIQGVKTKQQAVTLFLNLVILVAFRIIYRDEQQRK